MNVSPSLGSLPTEAARALLSRRAEFIVPTLPSAAAGVTTQLQVLATQSLLNLQEEFDSGSGGVSASQLPAFPSTPKTAQPSAAKDGASKGFVAEGYDRFHGQSLGSGQCVALVQAARPEVGTTSGWTRGSAVRGNSDLQPGTVIATFNGAGGYANAQDGSSHAAIYLGQDEHGIQVLDQWAGKPAAVRTISWSKPGASPSNTGERFHVVERAV